MTHGDPKTWVPYFRSADQILMEQILKVWPKCLDVIPEQPEEDFITENLVNLLSKDIVVRKLGHLDYQYEPFKTRPDGAVESTGAVDFALILDNDRSIYVAYECKRLNVRHSGSRRALATPYVNDGLMRFVMEKYSEGLPFACMLGYVMDSDVRFARIKVWETIVAHKRPLGLLSGPNSSESLSFIERFITTHQRSGQSNRIEVRHAFLPFHLSAQN